jgi:cyanoexosortase A
MKATNFATLKQLKYPQFWLLGIGAGLIAIHLTLTWKGGNSSLFGNSILYWAAILSQVWEKRHSLTFKSGIFSSILGLVMIGGVLLRSATLTSFGLFLDATPLIIGLSVVFLAFDFQGLKQYKGELFALFCLIGHQIFSRLLGDEISFVTAKLTGFILWYTGFNVAISQTTIHLPTGSIEVFYACAGIEQMFQMLGLSILFLIMFPQHKTQKILVPIVAILSGFIINCFRVALMAILVAQQNQEAFQYWHEGDGSLIFSMISVIVFGCYCWFLIERNSLKNKASVGSTK